jgi:hypothetical protein
MLNTLESAGAEVRLVVLREFFPSPQLPAFFFATAESCEQNMSPATSLLAYQFRFRHPAIIASIAWYQLAHWMQPRFPLQHAYALQVSRNAILRAHQVKI